MANLIPLPFVNSSLILSYIRTLASTDIPMVKMIPAIPGNVKTAPNEESTPKMKNIFASKATLETIPALL